VANDQIMDPDELAADTPGGDPDVTINVFDDRSRHADGLTVALVDPAEPAILKNGESIVDADPEAAGMIFEESGHLAARQGAAREPQPRPQAIGLAKGSTADPDRAISRRHDRIEFG